MLNILKVAKHLNMIQYRIKYIQEKTVVEGNKEKAKCIDEIIIIDLEHYQGGLKVANLPSEKMKDYCDKIIRTLEEMQMNNEDNGTILKKIDQCISLAGFIKVEC